MRKTSRMSPAVLANNGSWGRWHISYISYIYYMAIVHVLVSLWGHIISYHIIIRENNERWKFCELSLIFIYFSLSIFICGQKNIYPWGAAGNNERWKFCELWKNFRGYFIHYSLVLLLLFFHFIIFIIFYILSTPYSQNNHYHHHKILVWEKVLTLLL